MKRFVSPLLIVLIAAGSFISLYGSDSEKLFLLRKSIVEEQKRIEDLKKASESLADSRKKFAEDHRTRLDSRAARIRRITDEMAVLNKEYINEKASLAESLGNAKNRERQFDGYKASLKNLISGRIRSIKDGIPYKTDERTAALDRLLNEADIDSVRGEEIFSRFTAILFRDLNAGYDSEVFTQGGQKYFRLGWMFMAVSQDGTDDVKLLDRSDGKWIWKDDLSLSDRKALRDAMEMAEGHKPPSLEFFPVPLSLVRDSANAGEGR